MRKIPVGATDPPLTMTCTDDGAALDISTASTKTIKLVDQADGTVVVNDANVDFVSDGSDGQISYAWQAADTATARILKAQVTITWPSGAVTKFPDDSPELVEVTPSL